MQTLVFAEIIFKFSILYEVVVDVEDTRMWANAQRDGRPAEHRRCPLLNAAKFGDPHYLTAVQ